MELQTGMILVAHPNLRDPDFGHSVFLIDEHDGLGTSGVNLAGRKLKPRVFSGGPLPTTPKLLYAGEPVDGAFGIGATGYCTVNIYKDAAGLQPKHLLERKHPTDVVLVGHAGWGVGQLEGEMGMGIWLLTSATLDELLRVPPQERWNLALSKYREQ